MSKIIRFTKHNTVLVVAGILAIISCFFVLPDSKYPGYINLKVLSILFCLMLIVSCLVRLGVFDMLTRFLLARFHSLTNISLLFTIISFFMSMFLTNDVTLVTMVPFALMVLVNFDNKRVTATTMVLMTISANLGSMLTPLGNPQNLYLYSKYEYSLMDFILLMLPYSGLSLFLLIVCVFVFCRGKKAASSNTDLGEVSDSNKEVSDEADSDKVNSSHREPFGPWKMIKFLIYISLFTVSLLTVGHVIDYKITFVITAVIVLILDFKAYKGVDYSLLVTFVFFFVLTGNLGRIKEVTDAMCHILDAKPVLTAVGASQIISNVPAAMLLSTFTDNGEALIIGTNLGGLGTIIASMASLITYRFYGKYKTDNDLKDHYLLKFTIYNIVFLAALYGMYVVV
ncbi:MAG TPA: citrate transporter [Lachnospiraceae bacterium]|nr:citrate transporter [Lachnospiraceae bacterium]